MPHGEVARFRVMAQLTGMAHPRVGGTARLSMPGQGWCRAEPILQPSEAPGSQLPKSTTTQLGGCAEPGLSRNEDGPQTP